MFIDLIIDHLIAGDVEHLISLSRVMTAMLVIEDDMLFFPCTELYWM